MLAQLGDQRLGEHDGALAGPALGRNQHQPTAGLTLQGPAHAHAGGRQPHIRPLQAQRLPLPQAQRKATDQRASLARRRRPSSGINRLLT